MSYTIKSIDPEPARTNSSYGNWSVGVVKEYSYADGFKREASEFLYFWTKKAAVETIDFNLDYKGARER